MTTPCPSCVETIADLRQAVSDAIHNAYVSGALDVHNNYQEDRDPSFGEAAADYVASLDVNDMLTHFLPKTPAQRLAEECPHGMTEEAAQWVLDQRAERDEALAGYRAAVAFISADSWDGCSDCMEILHAARNADLHHDLTDPNDVAENLRRIRLHSGAAIRQMKDTAPE